jgi:hypothetical protein
MYEGGDNSPINVLQRDIFAVHGAQLEGGDDDEKAGPSVPHQELASEATGEANGSEQASPEGGDGAVVIDLDEAERDPNGQKRIAQFRLKRVADWRLKHKSWIAGLKKQELRPNDLQILYALALSIISWLAMMISFFIAVGAIGIVYSFPFPYVAVCIVVASSVIYQSRSFNNVEIGLWAAVNALYLATGVFWFIYDFELSEFSLGNVGEEAETAAQIKQRSAANFVFAYVLAAPTLAHGMVFVLRVVDRGVEGMETAYKAMGGLFFGGVFLMVLATFIFVSPVDGGIFIGAVLFVIYAAVQV